jgi:hypothetical protein
MKLKDILSISGKGGLFKFVSQARNGIIVESFADGKRMAVHSSAKVSALEDIAIFTDKEEVPLGDVFTKIYEKEGGKPTISHKASPEELKALLESILPDYDRSRVYVSDMKKLVMWYNLLLELDLLKPGDEDEEKDQKEDKKETGKGESAEKKSDKKIAKAPARKKPAAKPATAKPSTAAKARTASGASTKSK